MPLRGATCRRFRVLCSFSAPFSSSSTSLQISHTPRPIRGSAMSDRGSAMTLDDYQRGALRTVNPSLDERDRLLDASAGLAEEAAEVLGLIRKRAFQGKAVDQSRLSEELGDVLWCLAVTAHSLGVRLSDYADAYQEKLANSHHSGLRCV